MQEAVILSKEEYEALLAEKELYRKETMEYREIFKEVYCHNYKPSTSIVEINMQKLRNKLYHNKAETIILLRKEYK